MSNDPSADDPRQSEAARQYLLVSLAAILVLTLVLVFKDFGFWALLPLLFGVVSVLYHWQAGPVLQLLLLILLLFMLGPWGMPSGIGIFYASELRELNPVTDPLLVAALLAYSVAHFRLVGLTRNLLPVDQRLLAVNVRGGRRREVRGKPHLRPPETVGGPELLVGLLTVPLWTALAFIGWMILTDQDAPFATSDWPPQLWQAVLVLWVATLGLLLTATVFGYLRRLRAPVAEQLLYLQDQLWRATRGEQSLVNRWLTWARLRAQRRKEGP